MMHNQSAYSREHHKAAVNCILGPFREFEYLISASNSAVYKCYEHHVNTKKTDWTQSDEDHGQVSQKHLSTEIISLHQTELK